MRTAVARAGVPLINVEAVTPHGLALHVWRSMKPTSATRMIGRDGMAMVLAAWLHQEKHHDIRRITTNLGNVAAAIAADRLANRSAEWARSHARTSEQDLYADLFSVYEEHLRASGRLDVADVNWQAVDLVATFCDQRDIDAFLVCCDASLLPVQKVLFEEMGRSARVSGLVGRRELVQGQEGPWAAAVLEGWDVLSGDDASEAEPSSDALEVTPRILQAATRREEVWSVLADIVQRGIPFDDVEIVVSSPSDYRPLIQSSAARLSIPTTLSAASRQRVDSIRGILKSWADWVGSGYAPDYLGDIVRHPLFNVRTNTLDQHRLATLISVFRATPAMLGLDDIRGIVLEGARRQRIRKSEALAFLDRMMSFRKMVPDASSTPQRFAKVLRRFVDEWLQPSSHEDAFRALLDRSLEVFDQAPAQKTDSSWMGRFLADALSAPEAVFDTGQGIHVCAPDEAGFGSRSTLYVLGLDDQAAGNAGSVVDTHVVDLEVAQPTGYASPLASRRRMAHLFRQYGHALTFSLPAWDTRAARSLFPSSAIVGISRLDRIEPARRELRLDAADLSRRHGVHPAFQQVASGLEALQKKHSSDWTEHDGRTGSVSGPLAVRMSPSRMEQFLECPYRYFLGAVLGIDGVDEDDSQWLSRGDEGSILHDLFEGHTRKRADGQAGTVQADEEDMLEALRASLQRQASRSGVDPDAFVESRFKDLSHGVRRYFDRERALEGVRDPVHAEYSFSDREDADTGPAIFQSDLGQLMVTGRVDRIDESRDGSWVIVDYKTGKPDAFLPEKLLKLDEKLQWAIYAWAVAQVSNKQIDLAEYVFTSREGAGWVSQVGAPSSDELTPLLEAVLQRIQSGHFIPAPDEQRACKWCDFKRVCGDLRQRKTSIVSKFSSADPDETAAYEGWAVRQKNLPRS